MVEKKKKKVNRLFKKRILTISLQHFAPELNRKQVKSLGITKFEASPIAEITAVGQFGLFLSILEKTQVIFLTYFISMNTAIGEG